jgi:hypothetical protein
MTAAFTRDARRRAYVPEPACIESAIRAVVRD